MLGRCHRPGTDRQYTTYRQTDRHAGTGRVFIFDAYHNLCGHAHFVLCENVSSIVCGRRIGVFLLYYGLCCAPCRGIGMMRIVSLWEGWRGFRPFPCSCCSRFPVQRASVHTRGRARLNSPATTTVNNPTKIMVCRTHNTIRHGQTRYLLFVRTRSMVVKLRPHAYTTCNTLGTRIPNLLLLRLKVSMYRLYCPVNILVSV